jgi:riboflavin kinase/FMN adenylyltransferase
MKLLTSFDQIHKPFGLVIGNFDGVHQGHRLFLNQFCLECKRREVAPVVLSFDPHPRIFFQPDAGDFLITSDERKAELLEQTGLEYLVTFKFDQSLQKLSAYEFLTQKIFSQEYLKYLALGHDFALGAGKEDSISVARDLSKKFKVQISEEQSYSQDGKTLSSTLVRKQLKRGMIVEVNNLLERDFQLSGKVVPGQGLGSRQLVPTLTSFFG